MGGGPYSSLSINTKHQTGNSCIRYVHAKVSRTLQVQLHINLTIFTCESLKICSLHSYINTPLFSYTTTTSTLSFYQSILNKNNLMKLFYIFVLVILLHQVFLGLSNAANIDEGSDVDSIHKKHHHQYYHKKINCGYACSRRCRESSRKNVCNRACKTCCARCHCVPPGTYGNKLSCPCYAALRTHGNKPKCP